LIQKTYLILDLTKDLFHTKTNETIFTSTLKDHPQRRITQGIHLQNFVFIMWYEFMDTIQV